MKTGLWLWLLAVVLAGVGCQSSKTSGPPLSAQVAPDGEYLPQSVIVKGNVLHPVLPWTEDLTVSKAIVQAEYLGVRNPLTISIQRQGERLFVDPARLLMGIIDPWLEAGDIVELHTSTMIKRPYELGLHEFVPLQATTLSRP